MPNQSTDLTPYLFLAAMIVIGGLVAFVADSMGRKIGKKRLSFMGLRPRYTATLITVGAGILIPILTILAIYALSSEVRDWIREGRGAIARAKQYQETAESYRHEADKLESQKKALQTTNGKLSKETERLNEKIKSYEDKVALARRNLDQQQRLAILAQNKANTLQGKLTVTNRQIALTQTEIKSTKVQLNSGKKELAKLQSTFNTASDQLKENYQRGIELERQNSDLEKKLGSLQTDLSNLQTQKNDFEAQISSYKASINAYQESIRDYTERIEELRRQADEAAGNFQNNFMLTRTRPMIFEASEEVARVQLPPSLSPVAARNAFYDLLARSRTVALERKARSSPVLPSAGLSARQMNGRIVSEAEQEESVIRAITAQRNDLVFISRSFFNSFEGEYVLLEFVAYRNRLVYEQGKVIAEKRIDGRKADIEVLNQIQDFIGANVRAQALKDGMIPPSGRNGQLGSIEEEALLDLIKEVKSYNQMVRLQAVAKVDTMAGDRLELTFRVRL